MSDRWFCFSYGPVLWSVSACTWHRVRWHYSLLSYIRYRRSVVWGHATEHVELEHGLIPPRTLTYRLFESLSKRIRRFCKLLRLCSVVETESLRHFVDVPKHLRKVQYQMEVVHRLVPFEVAMGNVIQLLIAVRRYESLWCNTVPSTQCSLPSQQFCQNGYIPLNGKLGLWNISKNWSQICEWAIMCSLAKSGWE